MSLSAQTAAPDRPATRFTRVVFAGGGNRCFWQAGFWSVAAPALDLQPQVIAAVSAGAAISALLVADRAEPTLRAFQRVTAANPRNVHLRNLLGTEPVMPHAALYRRTLLEALDDAAVARIRSGPQLRVLLAAVPSWLGPRSGVLTGFLAYEVEKRLRQPVHPSSGRRLGFRPLVVALGDCRDAQEMTDLILASSSTPPMTPVAQWGGRTVLDGGLIDNVPVAALSAPLSPGPSGATPTSPPASESATAPTLVLLTRPYPIERLPRHPGRVYVQPSRTVPVAKWDYTDPEGLQRAWALGQADAAAFVQAQ